MAYIFMRFPEGKAKVLTLSYDDGVKQDMRLISIMVEHGLKGTFNISSGFYKDGGLHHPVRNLTPIDFYIEHGMEVAVHGMDHPPLEELPSHLCMQQIMQDRVNLEQGTGILVRGMAYPWGTYNDRVIDCAQKCGIVYSRTVKTTEQFSVPNNWMEWNPTCHHNNPRLMELATHLVEEQVKRRPLLFYVWGHSYEFDDHGNWNVMERFAAFAGGRDDVWYATNLEIYEYVQAYHRLVFSGDGTSVMNPNLMDVYIAYGEKTVKIPAGQRVFLNT